MEFDTITNEVIDAIGKLKKRLNEFSITDVYSLGNYSKALVAAITIAISLIELMIYDNCKLPKMRNVGLKADIRLGRHFDSPEERDILILYDRLSRYILNGT